MTAFNAMVSHGIAVPGVENKTNEDANPEIDRGILPAAGRVVRAGDRHMGQRRHRRRARRRRLLAGPDSRTARIHFRSRGPRRYHGVADAEPTNPGRPLLNRGDHTCGQRRDQWLGSAIAARTAGARRIVYTRHMATSATAAFRQCSTTPRPKQYCMIGDRVDCAPWRLLRGKRLDADGRMRWTAG